jgi:hypothetical protein
MKLPRPASGASGLLGNLGSVEVVVGLLIALGLDGLGLMIGIEDHLGKSTKVAIIAPPPGSEHRFEAIGTFARWRFAFERRFEPRSRASQRR